MKREHECEQHVPYKLYKIGMFARMNHVTIKALRHYDEVGLLKPAYVDSENGYRYYVSGQLPVIHQILVLRRMGFSLDEIREIQKGASERSLLTEKKNELLKEIAEKTAKLAQVECYLNEEEIDTNYHVLVKELPEVTVACMRRKMMDFDELFHMMPEMGEEMERLGCVCAEPEYCFSIYHDGEYREEDIDVEICEAVTEKKEGSDLIEFKTFPKVETAACILHKGPYTGFPDAYGRILKFVEENGYEIAGNPRESYIDGVWNKDSEEEWLSEIQFPVKKRETI